MCGRFTMTAGNAEIMKHFHIDQLLYEPHPSYNVAPSQIVPAVLEEESRKLVPLKWGLIPSWAKDPNAGNKMINARAESLREKPSFRNAFKKRRCLIVADGFYEWKKEEKTPYYIRLKSGELFGFAGLFDSWISPEGEEIRSCTIVTTNSNELIEPVHDRMPVIIKKENEDLWLDSSSEDMELLQSLLQPFKAEDLILYPVSKRVNRADHDSPECIEPVKN